MNVQAVIVAAIGAVALLVTTVITVERGRRRQLSVIKAEAEAMASLTDDRQRALLSEVLDQSVTFYHRDYFVRTDAARDDTNEFSMVSMFNGPGPFLGSAALYFAGAVSLVLGINLTEDQVQTYWVIGSFMVLGVGVGLLLWNARRARDKRHQRWAIEDAEHQARLGSGNP